MVTGLRRIVVTGLASYILLAPAPFAGVGPGGDAWAQSAAAAEALFDKGLAAMMEGRLTEACPAFAESYRLDPRPGTLFTLAECENKAGRLATAAAHYDDYLRLFQGMTAAQQTSQRGRDKVAIDQLAAIRPRIPKLTITLADGAPSETRVFMGKVELGAPSLGVALPIDPGSHVLRAEAPGRPPTEVEVQLDESETRSIELEIAPAAGDAAQTLDPAPVTSPGPDEAEGTSLTPIALVVGGVGVAGLVVGGITGGMVFAEKSTVDDNCVEQVCNAEGLDAADTASTLGLVSTIGFVAGGALVATAIVLLVADGSSEEASAASTWRVAPFAMPGSGGVAVGGRF